VSAFETSNEAYRISDALKDAHDHLKAGIAEMKSTRNEPPMSIYKAMHALTHALTEANERVNYAEGTAALAMKHRDKAEVKLAEAKKALEPFAACVFNDNGDVTITTSYLRTEHYMRAAKVVFSGDE